MGIKANFTDDDISRRFDAFLEAVIKRQIERLMYLGELVVKHAKLIPESAGFTDRTGNLRSSIGYIIFQDGIAIHEFFEKVEVPAKKKKAANAKSSETPEEVAPLNGDEIGKKYAETVGAKFPEGIVLVVVAGMNYALYVEAKGRDVLASAERLAIEELPKMLKQLTDNIEKAAA